MNHVQRKPVWMMIFSIDLIRMVNRWWYYRVLGITINSIGWCLRERWWVFHAKAYFYVISVKVFVKPGKLLSVVFRVGKKFRNKNGMKEKLKVFLLHKCDGPQFFFIDINERLFLWKFDKSAEIFMNHSCCDETCRVVLCALFSTDTKTIA